MSSTFAKRELPVIIVAALVTVMIIPFFFTVPVLDVTTAEIQRMIVPIAGFTLAMGGIDTGVRHFVIARKRREGWPFSVMLLIIEVFMLIATLTPEMAPIYNTIYISIIMKVNECVNALIAVFMASMAYRAFKMRSVESLLFGVSCLVVLLANAPLGEAIWAGGPVFRDWLNDISNMSAMRAVNIGVAFGILAYGMRTILGYERTALGEVELKRG